MRKPDVAGEEGEEQGGRRGEGGGGLGRGRCSSARLERWWRVEGGGTGEPDLTRPPGQAPCHCRGEGQTMDKNCLHSGEHLTH